MTNQDTQPYAKHGKVYIPAERDSELGITVTKIMYPWTVDATREQVQAALDARKENR